MPLNGWNNSPEQRDIQHLVLLIKAAPCILHMENCIGIKVSVSYHWLSRGFSIHEDKEVVRVAGGKGKSQE